MSRSQVLIGVAVVALVTYLALMPHLLEVVLAPTARNTWEVACVREPLSTSNTHPSGFSGKYGRLHANMTSVYLRDEEPGSFQVESFVAGYDVSDGLNQTTIWNGSFAMFTAYKWFVYPIGTQGCLWTGTYHVVAAYSDLHSTLNGVVWDEGYRFEYSCDPDYEFIEEVPEVGSWPNGSVVERTREFHKHKDCELERCDPVDFTVYKQRGTPYTYEVVDSMRDHFCQDFRSVAEAKLNLFRSLFKIHRWVVSWIIEPIRVTVLYTSCIVLLGLLLWLFLYAPTVEMTFRRQLRQLAFQTAIAVFGVGIGGVALKATFPAARFVVMYPGLLACLSFYLGAVFFGCFMTLCYHLCSFVSKMFLRFGLIPSSPISLEEQSELKAGRSTTNVVVHTSPQTSPVSAASTPSQAGPTINIQFNNTSAPSTQTPDMMSMGVSQLIQGNLEVAKVLESSQVSVANPVVKSTTTERCGRSTFPGQVVTDETGREFETSKNDNLDQRSGTVAVTVATHQLENQSIVEEDPRSGTVTKESCAQSEQSVLLSSTSELTSSDVQLMRETINRLTQENLQLSKVISAVVTTQERLMQRLEVSTLTQQPQVISSLKKEKTVSFGAGTHLPSAISASSSSSVGYRGYGGPRKRSTARRVSSMEEREADEPIRPRGKSPVIAKPESHISKLRQGEEDEEERWQRIADRLAEKRALQEGDRPAYGQETAEQEEERLRHEAEEEEFEAEMENQQNELGDTNVVGNAWQRFGRSRTGARARPTQLKSRNFKRRESSYIQPDECDTTTSSDDPIVLPQPETRRITLRPKDTQLPLDMAKVQETLAQPITGKPVMDEILLSRPDYMVSKGNLQPVGHPGIPSTQIVKQYEAKVTEVFSPHVLPLCCELRGGVVEGADTTILCQGAILVHATVGSNRPTLKSRLRIPAHKGTSEDVTRAFAMKAGPNSQKWIMGHRMEVAMYSHFGNLTYVMEAMNEALYDYVDDSLVVTLIHLNPSPEVKKFIERSTLPSPITMPESCVGVAIRSATTSRDCSVTTPPPGVVLGVEMDGSDGRREYRHNASVNDSKGVGKSSSGSFMYAYLTSKVTGPGWHFVGFHDSALIDKATMAVVGNSFLAAPRTRARAFVSV